jgi:hypothetical protein
MSDAHPFTQTGARRLKIAGIVILVIAVLAGIIAPTHGVDALSGEFAFNALFGFLACLGLIGFARLLGVVLKRGDRYYDR